MKVAKVRIPEKVQSSNAVEACREHNYTFMLPVAAGSPGPEKSALSNPVQICETRPQSVFTGDHHEVTGSKAANLQAEVSHGWIRTKDSPARTTFELPYNQPGVQS
ncbi:MAG: hypothetical protein EXR85_09670 [Xanthomonadales bacterium]|nr:hypothetical protein [Xanthomonadales bacterium]